MNENLINELLAIPAGAKISFDIESRVVGNLCHRAALELQMMEIEIARLSDKLTKLELPVIADTEKVASPKQHYEYIAEAEAALVKHKDAKLQREFLELSKEAVSKQQEYYQQQIDNQADQELSFFAAHAMGAMLGRNSFDTEDLAEIAFDHAQAMIDYKLKQPPKPRIWQCRCGFKNLDRTHCGNCGSLRNE